MLCSKSCHMFSQDYRALHGSCLGGGQAHVEGESSVLDACSILRSFSSLDVLINFSTNLEFSLLTLLILAITSIIEFVSFSFRDSVIEILFVMSRSICFVVRMSNLFRAGRTFITDLCLQFLLITEDGILSIYVLAIQSNQDKRAHKQYTSFGGGSFNLGGMIETTIDIQKR